jgi:hypothetical protein
MPSNSSGGENMLSLENNRISRSNTAKAAVPIILVLLSVVIIIIFRFTILDLRF